VITLERAAVLYVIFAPFAIAGGAGITSAHGGPWWAGAANGCMLVFMAWVFTGWIILFIQARQIMVSPVDTTIDTAPAPAAPMRHQAAPAGWNAIAMAADTTTFVPPDRIMLTVGNRLIPLKMTQQQARELARRITLGNRKISYDLYGRGKVFQRPDVDRLRMDLPRKRLADFEGAQVVLTHEAADAIRHQYPPTQH
jgi:hypothetical protein